MRRPTPLSPELGDVFRARDAIRAGVRVDRLRRSDLAKPFHGVRARGSASSIEAYAPLLRDGDRFSHSTAAMLWGAPLPAHLADQLHVTASRAARPRARGCIGHVSRTGSALTRFGLPLSDPAQTLIECATLVTLDELVAIADHLILDPRVLDPLDLRPHATLDDLRAVLAARSGTGVRKAREAAALARPGAESPMETRLRLLLSRAGLPEPECGFEVQRPDGRTVGWFDLAWPARRLLVEYDGDQHRTSTGQYERDIRRFDEATELGWRVVRVRRRGIVEAPEETIQRVVRAIT